MFVGETSSTESGGSKAAWISGRVSALPTVFPRIHGLLWYDVNSTGPGNQTDWPLESSAPSKAAFTTGIAGSAFATNEFANLDASPIAPPT
jgi:hypothetical protein